MRFGDKCRQWNAASDAGYAAARGKPIVVLHPPEHRHALEEVEAAYGGTDGLPLFESLALAFQERAA